MTELTREQIEKMREDAIYQSPLITGNVVELCNMALAKKDAEAECERLRADMQAICDESRALRQGGPFAEDALELHDALERAVEIAANAQTSPPNPADTATQAMGQLDEIQRDMDAPRPPEQAGDAAARPARLSRLHHLRAVRQPRHRGERRSRR